MKLPRPGMRNIKTGIGVMICVLVGYINLIDNVFFAAAACAVSMKTTVKSSLSEGTHRVMGTFIGGIVGFLFVLIKPGHPILSCIGIILTIYICNLLKINKSINIACIVYSAIYLNIGTENPLRYSVLRVIDNSMGVLIGVVVNYYLYRPNYLQSIHEEIKIVEKTVLKLLKNEIEHCNDMDKNCLKNEITKLENLYKQFLEEIEYNSSNENCKQLNTVIEEYKKIYLHLQILERMKDKCYISRENYIKSIDIYNSLDKDMCENISKDLEVKDNMSLVYNYHIGIIIDTINDIHKIEQTNNIYSENINNDMALSA